MDNPRYIDLNKLTARLPVLNDSGEYLIAISDVRRAISLAQAETGEVEEVVRCKDCDRGHRTTIGKTDVVVCHRYFHEDIRGYKDPMNYCSHGVRKEQT